MLTCSGGDKTIHTLDTYAGVLGNNRKKGTRKFKKAFSRFTKVMETCWFDEAYLNRDDTEARDDYDAFVECVEGGGVKDMKPRRRWGMKDVKQCSQPSGGGTAKSPGRDGTAIYSPSGAA